MSGEELTQQQIQDLAVRHQQYQYQAESIAQQMNMVQLTVKDIESALITIAALKGEPAGKETLVPIGFGSYIKAALTSPDKIVIGIGSEVSVEKKIDDAKLLLEKRKEELTKYFEQLNSAITKLAQEMQNIEKLVQKYRQSGQQPMRAQ